ncbi:unnamed protein product [Arctia plantaginis]|uniref:Uncharacterized protein n=1 Tax=Arctia plantaginis TaxID=874455 RepID=A0A8S1AXZ3_ARCPL|nr:unnamed protein product [Arctia plantaginis]
MEHTLTPATNNYTRKRKRNSDTWKKNVIKKQRYESKSMPQRVCHHNTPAFKCQNLTMAQMKKIHQDFYSHTNKKDQDAILLKLCKIMSANRTSKNHYKYKGKKQTTIKYGVIVNKTRIPICNKFFLHIFGITKHRVAFVMKKFYYTGEVGTEHRGGDRKTAKFADQKRSIHNYIATLQCIESHYCRKSKSAERKYLPSELSLSKLFKMYKRNKQISMLNPEPLPNIVAVNKNKLQDVKKLLQKHYGSEWVALRSLMFYKELLQTQEELVAPQTEESFCNESTGETIELHV